MAKRVDDAVMDVMLTKVATFTGFAVCSGEPANYAAIAGVTLASTTVTAGDGNGDYTIANGDTSGRKITIGQQADISITSSGTATHVVVHDGTTDMIVTTCTSQALTSGGTVTVNAFDLEIADAT